VNVQIPDMPPLRKIDAIELRLFWDQFFMSADYRSNLKDRILKGKAAHMEILLHHIVYGKPKETLALQAAGDGVLILNIGGQEKVSLEVGPDGMAKRKDVTPDGEVVEAEFKALEQAGEPT